MNFEKDDILATKTLPEFLNINGFEEEIESHNADDVSNIMKDAGFSPRIIRFYYENLVKHEKNSEWKNNDLTERIYSEYEDVFYKLELMTQPDILEEVPADMFQEFMQMVDDVVFNEKDNEEYSSKINSEFSDIRARCSDFLKEIESFDELVGDFVNKEEYKKANNILKKMKKDVENLELSANARFGWFMINSMSNVYIIDEKQRPNVQKIAKKRKNILGDYSPVKIAAGESLLNVINEIDDVENAEIYREVFSSQLNQILYQYKKTCNQIENIKEYKLKAQIIQEKPIEDIEVVDDLVAKHEESLKEVFQENVDTPYQSINSTKKPDEIENDNYSNNRSKSDIQNDILKAQQEWDKFQKEEDEKKRKEEVELAIIKQELEEIEKEEMASKIIEEEREIELNVVEKLYKKGETINFNEISPIEKDDNHDRNLDSEKEQVKRKEKELIRAQRKYEIKEVAECYDVDKLVVLKSMTERAKSETYMAVIENEKGQSSENDIVILNCDSKGFATYIGLRKNINNAIKLAEIHQKNNVKAINEDDILYYMMRNCRTEMQESNVERVTHHKKDTAPEIFEKVEKLIPPKGELKIGH